MKSAINQVITANGLKVGDTMKNVHGDPIEDSVVLGDYTVLIKDNSNPSRPTYSLISENALTGDETNVRIWPEGLAALKAITF